jgi:hypothetical protein
MSGRYQHRVASRPAREGPERRRAADQTLPELLFAAIRPVLVAVVLVAAIRIASLAIAAVHFIIGRRRTVYIRPGAFVLRHGAGARSLTGRRSPGQREDWA